MNRGDFMAKTRTSKSIGENAILEIIRKRLDNLFSNEQEPPTYMNISQVDALQARIAALEAELAQQPVGVEKKSTLPTENLTDVQLARQGIKPVISLPSSYQYRQGSFWAKPLANISVAWKMGLMVLIFSLAILGITVSAIAGMQTLRYHLSNIYDFMLIPIVAINQADTALANAQFLNNEQIRRAYMTPAEIAKSIEQVQTNETLADDTITKYETEWVTTISPEFTQMLRDTGHLDLQQQEVAALADLRKAFDEYKALRQDYSNTVQAGQPDEALANVLETKLIATRGHLQELISINNEFAEISNQQAQAAYQQALINVGMILVLALLFSLIVSYMIVFSITNRLRDLTRGAAAMQEGNLDQTVTVIGRDEVSLLGNTFNTMAIQVKSLFATMEQHVADRTHNLELASEVGRTITEKMSNVDDMLTDAAEMIRSRFNLYYTQVYLLDASGRTLILRAGTGEVGKQLLEHGHHLPVTSSSLNGRAVSEKKSIIVADTAKSEIILPNPLLPDTKSEIAVPLIVGGHVLGVLEMQSDRSDILNETSLPAFEVIAGQLAIAIQNAGLFKQAEEARSEVEDQIRRLTEHGWQDFLDAIERGQKIGFRFDQTNIVPLQANSPSLASGETFNAPITVTGTKIGTIELVHEFGRPWSATETELIQITAAQLAQHIDNLRLLAQADRYRAEAEQAVRRLTREGWNALQTQGEIAPGYIYNRNRVKSLSKKNSDNSDKAIKRLLIVRDETIGELAADVEPNSGEAAEIIAAVAEQLSGHIENLRLSEQNEKRAYEMETVAEVGATTSSVLDPDRLLQAVVDLTKERFGLYHAHIYLAKEGGQSLLLAVGAGEIGQKMVAGEHTIPIDAETSLVARAARQGHAVSVNDVRSEPGFLANPLLPETRAEMAVPMIVGNKLLGVFDVQSDRLAGFSKEDASIYTTLAAQVAVALQNARLYVEQAATVTQLRELDRLKSSFLANMSHELRTPLNSILGFADVILEGLDGPLTENMDNDLSLIQKNGQHLLLLINDVLDMAKIEAGMMNLNPERFKINEILQEVVSIIAPLTTGKALSLSVDDSSDQYVEVFADRIRIRQVMINLVNNAMKFTEKGTINICATQQDQNILISVRDTGIGIPPDKLEAVFQEFLQVDTSTTRKAGGSGLGLAISRRLIEMHGGRMWAESTGIPGEGSTFQVELPIEANMTEPIEKQEK
jgi:signal transduction histidine kinase/HAMP domain-containing protein